MDNYKEQLVKATNLLSYKLAKVFMYFIVVIAIILLAIRAYAPGVLLGIVALAMFFLKRFLYLEYEYTVTNGEVDIDKIIEMKSRKRVITFSVKDAVLVAPINSTEYRDFSDKPKEVITAMPKGCTERAYAAIVNVGARKSQIIFAPNKEFLDMCFLYNPRAVKKNI